MLDPSPHLYIKESRATKLLRILAIAVPAMMTFFFQFFCELINTYFIGRKDSAELLASVGLGNIILNMTCTSVFLGMNGALETLISQAIGSGKTHLSLKYLSRGRIIVMLLMIPVSLILLQVD